MRYGGHYRSNPYTTALSNSKFFFLCTKLSINSRHPTNLTYCSCIHNADSLDHPHLPIRLSCPEPMLYHLQIAHSSGLDQKNGTLTTSRMLTLFTFSRNSSNVFYSNKCIKINFIQLSWASLNNFGWFGRYKNSLRLIDWLIDWFFSLLLLFSLLLWVLWVILRPENSNTM